MNNHHKYNGNLSTAVKNPKIDEEPVGKIGNPYSNFFGASRTTQAENNYLENNQSYSIKDQNDMPISVVVVYLNSFILLKYNFL